MSGKWHGGKGSRRRTKANDRAFREGYDRIFGNGDSVNGKKEQRKEKDG